MEMSTLSERIQERLKAVGLTSNAASVKATGSPSTIQQILLGRSKNPRIDTLEKIASVLKCRVEWLRTGNGPIEADSPQPPREAEVSAAPGIVVPVVGQLPRDLPVMGTVAGAELGKGAFQLTSDVIDYVRRPAGLLGAADAFALYVEGTSMSPKFEPGDLVFVHPHRKPRGGDYVVIEEPDTNNGEPRGFIKRLVTITGTQIRTEQLNPPSRIDFILRPGTKLYKVILDRELYGV